MELTAKTTNVRISKTDNNDKHECIATISFGVDVYRTLTIHIKSIILTLGKNNGETIDFVSLTSIGKNISSDGSYWDVILDTNLRFSLGKQCIECTPALIVNEIDYIEKTINITITNE